MAEVEAEREMSRAEVAAYLHEFADKLGGGMGDETNRGQSTEGESTTASENEADSAEAFVSNEADTPGKTPEGEHGGKVTFTVGNDSATINPPDTVRFEMAVDSTSGVLESSAHETVEFALHWDTEATDEEDNELDIQ